MKLRTAIVVACSFLTISATGQEAATKHRATNIISIAPLSVGGEGLGMGLGYERSIGRKEYFSFVVSVSSPFIGYVNNNGTFGREFQTFAYLGERQRILQLSPGIKFYPVGNKGRARYAVAALYNYQAGDRESTDFYNGEKNIVSTNKMAVLLQNSVNLFPTTHLYIGTELGLGYTFFNEAGHNGVVHRIGRDDVIQLAFRVGYRF